MNTGKLNIILTKNDNGVITATIPGIPQIVAQGKTEDIVLTKLKKILDLFLKRTMKKSDNGFNVKRFNYHRKNK